MKNPLNVEVGEILEFSDYEDFKNPEVDRFAQYSNGDDEKWYSENAGWRFARRIPEVTYKNPMPIKIELKQPTNELLKLDDLVVPQSVENSVFLYPDTKTLRDEFAMAANETDIKIYMAMNSCTAVRARYYFADECLKARKQGDGK